VIVANRTVTFTLKDVNDQRIFEILGNSSFLPHQPEHHKCICVIISVMIRPFGVRLHTHTHTHTQAEWQTNWPDCITIINGDGGCSYWQPVRADSQPKAWSWVGGHLAPFYIHQMNRVNYRNGSAMMTAPYTLSWLFFLAHSSERAIIIVRRPSVRPSVCPCVCLVGQIRFFS